MLLQVAGQSRVRLPQIKVLHDIVQRLLHRFEWWVVILADHDEATSSLAWAAAINRQSSGAAPGQKSPLPSRVALQWLDAQSRSREAAAAPAAPTSPVLQVHVPSVHMVPDPAPTQPAKPRSLHGRAQEGSEADCSVCLEQLFRRSEAVACPPCGHIFHRACLVGASRDRTACPVCAKQFSAEQILRLFW